MSAHSFGGGHNSFFMLLLSLQTFSKLFSFSKNSYQSVKRYRLDPDQGPGTLILETNVRNV